MVCGVGTEDDAAPSIATACAPTGISTIVRGKTAKFGRPRSERCGGCASRGARPPPPASTAPWRAAWLRVACSAPGAFSRACGYLPVRHRQRRTGGSRSTATHRLAHRVPGYDESCSLYVAAACTRYQAVTSLTSRLYGRTQCIVQVGDHRRPRRRFNCASLYV